MIELIAGHIMPAAFALLPPAMNTPAAKAMLLAIGLQESRFLSRRQWNYGPARGFWQFEKGGVRGVCRHPDTITPLNAALRTLRYESLIGQTANLHYAIEDNDVLACVFARLLLWSVPAGLPPRANPTAGWSQYLAGWNPGKPHRPTWDAYYSEAWDRVETIDGEVIRRRLT